MRPLFAFLLALTALHAELSPDHYRRLQAEAPESLVLLIGKVDTQSGLAPDGLSIDVTVTAQVKQVLRSRSGLKPGANVTIRYQVLLPATPLPGPSQPPVLGKGETKPAFLKPGEGTALTLAAGGKSFEKL
jgi:hypothetical protein